jgi:hypothetical protein
VSFLRRKRGFSDGDEFTEGGCGHRLWTAPDEEEHRLSDGSFSRVSGNKARSLARNKACLGGTDNETVGFATELISLCGLHSLSNTLEYAVSKPGSLLGKTGGTRTKVFPARGFPCQQSSGGLRGTDG